MSEIIHYWRLDDPKEDRLKAIREIPIRSPKALSQLTSQFSKSITPVHRDRAAYPWFKPFPTRPLLALAVCPQGSAADTYVTIEADPHHHWTVGLVNLLRSGPSPVTIKRWANLEPEAATSEVQKILGAHAPSILRSAPWRLKEASVAQRNTLARITKDNPPELLTSGEASDTIAALRFKNRQLQKFI